MRVIVIRPTAAHEASVLTQEHIEGDHLAGLQQLVGGYVERVRLIDLAVNRRVEDVVMWVNDEGLVRGQDRNVSASFLYGSAVHGAAIHGAAVLTGERFDGDAFDVTDVPQEWTCEAVTAYLRQLTPLPGHEHLGAPR